jgi:hypothetical protein
VTFFEILVGRTPFENTEGEQFATKAALEDYWQRTVRFRHFSSVSYRFTKDAGVDARKVVGQLEDVERH